jgi:hypothetical protein
MKNIFDNPCFINFFQCIFAVGEILMLMQK